MSYISDLPEHQWKIVRNLLDSNDSISGDGTDSFTELVDVPLATTPSREMILTVSSAAGSDSIRIETTALGTMRGVLPIMGEQEMKKLVR